MYCRFSVGDFLWRRHAAFLCFYLTGGWWRWPTSVWTAWCWPPWFRSWQGGSLQQREDQAWGGPWWPGPGAARSSSSPPCSLSLHNTTSGWREGQGCIQYRWKGGQGVNHQGSRGGELVKYLKHLYKKTWILYSMYKHLIRLILKNFFLWHLPTARQVKVKTYIFDKTR